MHHATHSNVLIPLVMLALLSTITASAGADDTASKSNTLRVASVSFVPTKWDKDTNAAQIEKLVRDAARQGARLVITPEGALEGYVVNEVIHAEDAQAKAELTARFQELAEPIDGPYVRRIAAVADELDIFVILGVLLRNDDATTFNSTVLLGPEGKVVGLYNKTHFHQGYDVNPSGYTPGDKYPVFNVDAAKLGMMICFDRQLPEPARALALGGANLIVCPSYGGTGDWNTRMMQVRAYENDVYLVLTHPRQSLIIAPDGEMLAESEGDAVTLYDLDLSRKTRQRQSIRYRRPDTYGDLNEPR
jgi:predicted amidohydrolase